MPNQPLINALMGGQLGQQQPFGSNIFGTNNQQWGAGGSEQTLQQPNPTGSPWPQQDQSYGEYNQAAQTELPQNLQWLFQMLMGRGKQSPVWSGQSMPWGQQQGGPWGQQGGQG